MTPMMGAELKFVSVTVMILGFVIGWIAGILPR